MRWMVTVAVLAGCSGEDPKDKGGKDTTDTHTTPTTDTHTTPPAPTGDTAPPENCLADPFSWGAPVSTGGTGTYTGTDPALGLVQITCAGGAFKIYTETTGVTGGGSVTFVAASSDNTVSLVNQAVDPDGWWQHLGYNGGTGCDADLSCATFLIGIKDGAGAFDSCVVAGPKTDDLLSGAIHPTSTAIDARTCTPL